MCSVVYRDNMLARTITHALVGLDPRRVEVEAHLQRGVPAFTIVGLADRACQEAKERVRSGIASAELEWPLRRITVNLAPADLRKEGSGFDLPIALARARGVTPDPAGLPGRARRGRRARPRRPAAAGRRRARGGRGRTAERLATARLRGRVRRPRSRSPASSRCRCATWPRRWRTSGASGSRRSRNRLAAGPAPPPSPISATSAARSGRAGCWRSPRRADTTSCSPGRRASARRCSPGGSRASCRCSTTMRRSR